MKKPNLYFIQGGLGKNFMFSSIVNNLSKKDNNKVVIQASFQDVFKDHPNVISIDNITASLFTESSQKHFSAFNKIIYFEPYNSNFLKGDTHLIETYAEHFNFKTDNFLPDFYIDKELEKKLKNDIIKLNQFIIVQFKGGVGYVKGRDYNYGQDLVDKIRKKYPFINILYYGHPDQCDLKGVIRMPNETWQAFTVYAKYCRTFVAIDSSLMHICSNRNAFKKGVCLWGASNQKQFGYKEHINLNSDFKLACDINPEMIIKKLELLLN